MLLLCSYGLRPEQISIETIAQLRSCDMVFSNSLNQADAERFKPYCRKLCAMEGCSWEALMGRVFKAFSNKNKIAFLTYGNPFFLTPAAILAKKAARRGIDFKVMEGVSSFDAIINHLRLGEYAPDGLRLVNLGDSFVDKTRKCTPSMDTLFFSLWRLNVKGNSGIKKNFVKELSSAYGPVHPVVIIDHPHSVKTTIALLGHMMDKVCLTTTIYVPAVMQNRYRRLKSFSARKKSGRTI